MKQPRIILLFIIFILLFIFTSTASGDEEEKQWATLVDNTQVYGYWKDIDGSWILIECNPADNKETGYAFINSGRYETTEKEVVDSYEYVTKEDFEQVTKLAPVNVDKVFAPNMPIGHKFDSQYYAETAEVRNITTSQVTWPGSKLAQIVPTDDPKRWLIVASVTNPNPFSVKAQVEVNINTGRSSSIGFNKEITFQANETRYIKLNDKTQTELFERKGKWDDGWHDGWSNAWISTSIKENLDPRLPKDLKPNYGWLDDWYGLDYNLNDPVVFNANSQYRFEVFHSAGKVDNWWRMKGLVKYTEDGWQVICKEIDKPEYETTAINTMKSWVESVSPDFPTLRDDDDNPLLIDGTYEWQGTYTQLERFYPDGAMLSNNSSTWEWDQTGPVIVGYNYNYTNLDQYEQSWDDRPSPVLDDPSIVGWHKDRLPIIEKEPIFIPIYDFISQEDPDIGYLEKNYLPGYFITDDDVPVPKFNHTVSYVGCNISGNTYTFTYDVKIEGVNNSPYDCVFSSTTDNNLKFYLPTVSYLKNYMQEHNNTYQKNGVHYYNEPEISDPSYDVVDTGITSVEIPKNSIVTVYNQRRTVTFILNEANSTGLDNENFSHFFTDSREASFVSNLYEFMFIPDENLLGIAKSAMGYEKFMWDNGSYKGDNSSYYGSSYGIPVISAIHRGFSMLPTDQLYGLITQSTKRHSIYFPNSDTNVINSNFWPVASGFDTKDVGSSNMNYKDLYYNEYFISYHRDWSDRL
ncbi:hypothetical protein JCM14036_10440 [Desulfotomaculum defluvii]